VRDLLDAFRLQAGPGPVTDKALEGIIFRASEQRLALPPNIVRLLLTALLENMPKRKNER
jgi:hypothetical protein